MIYICCVYIHVPVCFSMHRSAARTRVRSALSPLTKCLGCFPPKSRADGLPGTLCGRQGQSGSVDPGPTAQCGVQGSGVPPPNPPHPCTFPPLLLRPVSKGVLTGRPACQLTSRHSLRVLETVDCQSAAEQHTLSPPQSFCIDL